MREVIEYETDTPEAAKSHNSKTPRNDASAARLTRWALLVNTAFHPLLVPLYVTGALLFGNTVSAAIPAGSRWFFMLTVMFNACLMPALAMALLGSLGFSLKRGVGAKRYAFISILVAVCCLVSCIWMLGDIYAAYIVRRVLVAAAGCMFVGAVVGLFTYVSSHMLAAGIAVGTLLWIDISGLGTILPQIVLAILASGAVASARLYLGKDKYGSGIIFLAAAVITAILLTVI